MKTGLYSGLFFLMIGFLTGCATVEPDRELFSAKFPEPERQGIYHKVRRNETLWRIAMTYDVPLKDIVRTNNMPNAAQVEIGQLIFIPGAEQSREILLDNEETEKDFIWPLQGKVVSYFQQKSGDRENKGIDIQAEEGQTVMASRTGRVTFADYLVGYGQTVILDHSDGYYSVYAHNKDLLVDVGDLVFKQKEIARVGRSSHEAYLHFEIRKNSVEDNPLYYLP